MCLCKLNLILKIKMATIGHQLSHASIHSILQSTPSKGPQLQTHTACLFRNSTPPPPPPPPYKAAEKHVASLFNLKQNSLTGQDMVVTARKAIKVCKDKAIELLANYGLSYWFAFAVNNHVRLGHDSVLVKGIFWLLF